MKNILILCLILVAILLPNCGNSSKNGSVRSEMEPVSEGTADLVFREYEHNFGKVIAGEKVAYVFSFENKGNGNLVINNATASCGCTVPKYKTKPIEPGETGEIEVVFNTSGFNGMQTKTIKVKSNASIPIVLLKITAEIVTNNNN